MIYYNASAVTIVLVNLVAASHSVEHVFISFMLVPLPCRPTAANVTVWTAATTKSMVKWERM